MLEDLCYLDVTEMARRIRAKEASPVELLRAHLERIEAVNPKINAVVTLMPGAEERARAAEAAVLRGDAVGPLHGVPFTIKDCVDTAGVRTTRGSQLFADHVPEVDAVVVARLTAAGGIPLAKTNLPEFALWWETGNLVFGRTVNPWNLHRTAGGSSGGEAAAIAAGLSPLGIGSDVGGSIRAPAHYCGIVGLKPTHGRVPLTGHFPETLLRFMHVGPMARTVRDVALGLQLMAGADGRDFYAMRLPNFSTPELVGAHASGGGHAETPAAVSRGDRDLIGLRVGWMAERGFGPVHREVVATVIRAAGALRQVGCQVEPVELPGLERRDCNVLSMTLFGTEGRPYFEPIIRDRHADLHPVLRTRLTLPGNTLVEYLAAEAEVEGLRRDIATYFGRYDILLCPTVPVPAQPHETADIVIDGQTLPPRHVLRATIPFDLTGSPALSVPYGWSSEGLPIGVQVVGRHLDDAAVLRVGLALESTQDTIRRRPPI